VGALPAEFLGPFRLVPNSRVFQLAVNLYQPVLFDIVVKDTPSGYRYALAVL